MRASFERKGKNCSRSWRRTVAEGNLVLRLSEAMQGEPPFCNGIEGLHSMFLSRMFLTPNKPNKTPQLLHIPTALAVAGRSVRRTGGRAGSPTPS